MPNHWLAWVGLLIGINFILPLLYLHSLEAKIIILCLLIGAFIQLVIFTRLGFVRLLGVGHFIWIPLVYWLIKRLPEIPQDTSFYKLAIVIIVCNSLSLIIDMTDLVRYFRGERQPTVS